MIMMLERVAQLMRVRQDSRKGGWYIFGQQTKLVITSNGINIETHAGAADAVVISPTADISAGV